MSKANFLQQQSINDARDATFDHEDEHLEKFHSLLFDHLLRRIRSVPFQETIQDLRSECDKKGGLLKNDGLSWKWTADRKYINSKTIYSFRFPNPCNWEYYKPFEIEWHPLFEKSSIQRHRCMGWYRYKEQEVVDSIGDYLDISGVIQPQAPYRTELYINKECERLDIVFSFFTIKTKITITFEHGSPEKTKGP